MKRIVVASKNPVKLRATLEGFQALFPDEAFEIESIVVSSGVGDQPYSDEETLQGAIERAEAAWRRKSNGEAEYWVGIEGGVRETEHGMEAFAWVVVKSTSILGKGKTGTFFLPEAVAELVRDGKELGEADDIVFERQNSKQDVGAVGLLTNNLIDRTEFYKHATILALIPFKNPAYYAVSYEGL